MQRVHSMVSIFIVTVLLTLGLPVVLHAQTMAESPAIQVQQTVSDILEEIQESYRKLNTLFCLFLAESKNATTGMVDKMSGELWVRFPDKMRWEYKEPVQTIVFDGKQLCIYFIEDKQVFLGPADAVSGINLIFMFFKDTEGLEKEFKVSFDSAPHPEEKNLHHLLLEPKSDEAGIDTIQLTWDGKHNWITRLQITDMFANIVKYQFDSFQKNPRIKKQMFQVKYPDDVEMFDLDGNKLNKSAK